MTNPPIDRFTLPGDIPDAAGPLRDDTSTLRHAQDSVSPQGERNCNTSAPPEDARSGERNCNTSAHPEEPRSAVSKDHAAEEAQSTPEEDPGAARGYAASHPAGRGWIPQSRDLGIPSEHAAPPPRDPYAFDSTVRIEHSFPDGSPDDPVAAIGIAKVFTRERRIRFLDYLAFKGNVRAAAARVGVSHETAYRKRRQDPAFAQLWDAAMVHARSYGESLLGCRAIDGVEVPIVYQGQITGYRVHHDPRLLLAHLGRLDRMVESETAEASAARASAGRFDELLAHYAGHRPPPDFAEAAQEMRCGWGGRGTASSGGDWAGAGGVGAGAAGAGAVGAGAPALPPTRVEYVTYHRGEAIDAFAAACKDEAHPDWSEDAEAEAVTQAGEDAALAWDDHHTACLATVARIVGAEDDEDGDQSEALRDASSTLRQAQGSAAPQGERISSDSAHPEEARSAVSKDHAEEGLSSSPGERIGVADGAARQHPSRSTQRPTRREARRNRKARRKTRRTPPPTTVSHVSTPPPGKAPASTPPAAPL